MNKIISVFTAALTLLLVACATPATAQQQQWAWDNVERVVALGDEHGDYAKFEDQLRQAGLINARGDWTGGRTHLVQLGDVPDRGPGTRQILDHLMRLERQAQRAGGHVHALIGNHEAMNMEGDLRYTTPEEFAAFADRTSSRRRDAYYQRYIAALRQAPPAAGLPTFDDAYRAQFDAEHPLGWVEHQMAWSPQGVYGKWIITHNAVIRINDTLYMHAGISPAYVTFDIGAMDDAIRAALVNAPVTANSPPDPLGEQGPLWYRGLALNGEAERPHVDAILARYNVRHIVLGHTKRFSTVTPRFGGAVILTDIAVPDGYADPHAFLIQENGALFAMHRGHRVAIRTSGPELCAYLSEIAGFDGGTGPVAQQATQCAAPPAAAAPATTPN